METKTKRCSSRSLIKAGGSHSRRGGGGSRSKETSSCLTTSVLTNDAAAGATGTSKNALRERTRVESLRRAYLELQAAIPSVPPNTKLSKLDVLMLATTYISHLTQLLQEDDETRKVQDDNNNDTSHVGEAGGGGALREAPRQVSMQDACSRRQKGLLHPVKVMEKWPMRARLYADVGAAEAGTLLEPPRTYHHHHHHHHLQLRNERVSSSPYPPQSPYHVTQPRMQTSLPPPPVNRTTRRTHNQPLDFCTFGGYDGSLGNLGKPIPRPHIHPGGRMTPGDHTHRVGGGGGAGGAGGGAGGGGGGQQWLPVTANTIPGYTNSWNSPSDFGWDPYMTYHDLNGCQSQCHVTQPIGGLNGCWSMYNA